MMSFSYFAHALDDLKDTEARCIECKEPFSSKNVFTTEGMREIAISGMCEKCFDEIFEDEE